MLYRIFPQVKNILYNDRAFGTHFLFIQQTSTAHSFENIDTRVVNPVFHIDIT